LTINVNDLKTFLIKVNPRFQAHLEILGGDLHKILGGFPLRVVRVPLHEFDDKVADLAMQAGPIFG
jgi:hypothetical protein